MRKGKIFEGRGFRPFQSDHPNGFRNKIKKILDRELHHLGLSRMETRIIVGCIEAVFEKEIRKRELELIKKYQKGVNKNGQ